MITFILHPENPIAINALYSLKLLPLLFHYIPPLRALADLTEHDSDYLRAHQR